MNFRHFVVVSVLFEMLFAVSTSCFADIASDLELAKNAIYAQIEAGQFETADATLEQIKTELADYPDLPLWLCEIAVKYAQAGDIERFKLQLSFIADYTNTEGSTFARLLLNRFAIEDLIDQGDHVDAEARILQMKSEFTEHPDLPMRLCEIAQKYAQIGDVERFKSQLAVVANYPNSETKTFAQLHLRRFAIEDQIDQGDHVGAEAKILQMQSEFAGHPELPMRLFEIAVKYGRVGDTTRFKSQLVVVTDYPKSSASTSARAYLARFAIEDMIDQGNHAGAEAAVLQMQSEFAGHPDLPLRLCEIAQKYAQIGDVERFKSQLAVVANYPNSETKTFAQLHLRRFAIEDQIDQGDHVGAEAKILQMQSEFAGHSDLPWRLGDVAYKYSIRGETSQAKALYQEIVENFNQDREMEVISRAKLAAYEISDYLTASQAAEIDTIIAQIKTQFSDQQERALAFHVVAETLNAMALKFDDAQHATTTEYLQRSISLYEKEVLGQSSRKDVLSETYWVLGTNYNRIGEYAKSIKYYQKHVDEFPDHRHDWHVRFLIGKTYQKMKQAKLLTAAEANFQTHQVYEQLVAAYPDCKAAQAARQWLDYHNFN